MTELEDDGDDTETFAIAAQRDYDEDGQLLHQTEDSDDLGADPATHEEADSDLIAEIVAEVEASEYLHAGSIRTVQFVVTKVSTSVCGLMIYLNFVFAF